MFPKPHREQNKERDENAPRRNIEDVVCYKCGYKGHYANKCNKGHLAFLSHKAGPNTRDAGRNT
jgi:cleavage and polyadenylation specificity factor subunit 4